MTRARPWRTSRLWLAAQRRRCAPRCSDTSVYNPLTEWLKEGAPSDSTVFCLAQDRQGLGDDMLYMLYIGASLN
jgi:hypothetical protein